MAETKTNYSVYTKAADLRPFMKLNPEEEARLQEILEVFPMLIPDYYLRLIDWSDPADPIRRMCVPSITETDIAGEFDTSGEADNTVVTGLQHKYRQTALILSTNRCAMYCRHCFRKRLVGLGEEEIAQNFDQMMNYIKDHEEISNVLISGGDSLLLANQRIEEYLAALTAIEHLDLIRFGTRTPVVCPDRIIKDKELQAIFVKYAERKQIYVVTQFNHPRELTPEAQEAIRLLLGLGIVVKNQTVLLHGVNDEPAVLGELLRRLTAAGVVPYYIFQCRPVRGVKAQFQVPLRRGLAVVEAARNLQNGQGKCVRYCMSTPRGKIEILGEIPEDRLLFKFNQAKDEADAGRIFAERIAPEQCWLD